MPAATASTSTVTLFPDPTLPFEITDKVIDVVDKFGGANLAAPGSFMAGRGRGIVFLAWGAWAAKRVAKLDTVRPIQSVIPALHLIPRALPAHTVVRKGISS